MARYSSQSRLNQEAAAPTWPTLATTIETTLPPEKHPNPPVTARLVLHRLSAIRQGSLRMRLPDGNVVNIGNTMAEPAADLTVHRWRFFRRLLAANDIGAGEAYMDGDWSTTDLVALTSFFLLNEEQLEPSPVLGAVGRIRDRLLHRARDNSRQQARRNIQAHYDLSNQLYATFLDSSMTYSSGIFQTPETSLADAQRQKYLRLAKAAGVVSGAHVIEIGCGWGGFAELAASELGCRVTGITLSAEQALYARERMKRAGLDDRVEIRVVDYRDVTGTYDALVSIEMLEAVGHRHLGSFFAACDRLLNTEGQAAIQTITIPDQVYDRYRRGTDWIRKHIFPGGHLPSLGAIQQAVSRSTPFVIDTIEDIGPHYAITLNRWRRRFRRHLDTVRGLGFDDRFIRMWEFYLSSCEAAFAHRKIGNLQFVLRRAEAPAPRSAR